MPRHLFQVTVNLPATFRNNLNNNEVFNPYVFVRNRLYHFVFNSFALMYARIFSEVQRKVFEFLVLLTSLFCFITLVYVHMVFVQHPMTCLDSYRELALQNNSLLRIELFSSRGKENYTLEDSYWKERALFLQQLEGHTYEEGVGQEDPESTRSTNEDDTFVMVDEKESYNSSLNPDEIQKVLFEDEFQPVSEHSILASDPEGAHILEFSLEMGFLRLTPAKRKEFNITVTLVVLDPEVDKCFGGSFNKFLLDNFLGYEHVLMSSIKNLLVKKHQKGFIRNAVIDVEYAFSTDWANNKSYLIAGLVMVVFTVTISTLLRHSHHQIFIVVGFWMHHIISALERRSNFFDIVWPRNLIPSSSAPILSVILALVGMEAVMSDFFNDRSIALNVIIIVWFADLYDAVCCQSPLSKRHWFRFFYLYHYLFYAYNHRFGGVYWPLTLMTSSMFTFHSMIFFFHHYELPRFLYRAARVNAARANRSPDTGGQPPPANARTPDENPSPEAQEVPTVADAPNDQSAAEITDSSDASNNLVPESSVLSDIDGNSLQSSVADSTNSPKTNCLNDSHSYQMNPGTDPIESAGPQDITNLRFRKVDQGGDARSPCPATLLPVQQDTRLERSQNQDFCGHMTTITEDYSPDID